MQRKVPIFSKIFLKYLLESLAAVCINLKAKIDVVEENDDHITYDINYTRCTLTQHEKDIIVFTCEKGFQYEHYFSGASNLLKKKRILQCYSILVNTIYNQMPSAEYIYASEDDKREIQSIDVVVKSNINYCQAKQHHIKDVIAKIHVQTSNGDLNWNFLHAAYCNECNKYYILNTDYALLEGIPTCKVVEIQNGKEYEINKVSDSVPIHFSESIIHAKGYNVNQIDDFPAEYRQQILINIINEKVLTQEQILSYLDSLIYRWKHVPKYSLAVSKWIEDRKFIQKKWFDNPEIIVSSITKKTRI